MTNSAPRSRNDKSCGAQRIQPKRGQQVVLAGMDAVSENKEPLAIDGDRLDEAVTCRLHGDALLQS